MMGLQKNHFNYCLRWKIDIDYQSKLNDSQKNFLAQFLKEFYECKNFKEKNMIKKKDYLSKNATERDFFNRFKKVDIIFQGAILAKKTEKIFEGEAVGFVRDERGRWASIIYKIKGNKIEKFDLEKFDLQNYTFSRAVNSLKDFMQDLKKQKKIEEYL